MQSIPLILPCGIFLENLPENGKQSATYSDREYPRFSPPDPAHIPRYIPVCNNSRLVWLFRPRIVPVFRPIFALQSQRENVSEYREFHERYTGHIPLRILSSILRIFGVG
jgi:hypothetical protein